MSTLTKEQYLQIKEQFKSVHNVLPSRFLDDEEMERLHNQHGHHHLKQTKSKLPPDPAKLAGKEGDASSLKGTMSRRNTYVFKLPGADGNALRKSVLVSKDQKSLEEKEASRSMISTSIKKYNYTKNSLNCIPLTNKFRQWFIRFVEWKHQGNIVLVFVAVNSIFLGMVDYRFKGSYQDPDAPLGNYILGITEPVYAVLFTAEALIKIIAQGFIMSKKTYLRDPWNALDFAVVITALLSFSPDISSVSILRAFRLFKPLRNLQVFPSMRLLIRTLVASADRLRFLMIFYFFVIMIFSIIGVNLMQGVTTYRCRQTPYPVDGDWLVVPTDGRTCGWVHQCEFACGSLYQPDVVVNGSLQHFDLYNVTDLGRDSMGRSLLFGYANFNNLYQGFLTLFQISTLQDWYKIMYLMQDSYNSYIAGMFFVIYVLISNYFMHILTIGIIMQRFIELNDHKERQQIYQTILGMRGDADNGDAPVNIEELKNKFREEEKRNVGKVKKQKTLKQRLGRVLQKLAMHEEKPMPATKYYTYRLPQWCWKIQQNIVYEAILMVMAVINAFILAFVQYPEPSDNTRIQALLDVIDYTTILTTAIYSVDQIIKLIGLGLKEFIINYENVLYTLTSVGAFVHIGYNGGRQSPIIASTVFKIFKIIRRANYYQTFNQLIDSIIFTLSVMMSYCAIMVLFVYIFSLLGMQFFAGKLLFNENGDYDPFNGKVPRQNFDTIIWSTTCVLQTLIGDDWSLVMFNCMQATGWYACLYFFALIIFGYIILMNLFLAILIGNFEEASLIMRDTKFLKNIKKANEPEGRGNQVGTDAGMPLINFNRHHSEQAADDEKLNPYAVLNQEGLLTPSSGQTGKHQRRKSNAVAVTVGGMYGPKPLIVVDTFLRSFKGQKTFKAGTSLKMMQKRSESDSNQESPRRSDNNQSPTPAINVVMLNDKMKSKGETEKSITSFSQYSAQIDSIRGEVNPASGGGIESQPSSQNQRLQSYGTKINNGTSGQQMHQKINSMSSNQNLLPETPTSAIQIVNSKTVKDNDSPNKQFDSNKIFPTTDTETAVKTTEAGGKQFRVDATPIAEVFEENLHSVFSSDPEPEKINSLEKEEVMMGDDIEDGGQLKIPEITERKGALRVTRMATVKMEFHDQENQLVIKNVHRKNKVVTVKKRNPLLTYVRYSSMFLFHRKSRFRQQIYNITIDPEYLFEPAMRQVAFEDLDEQKKRELLSQGYKRNNQFVIHRTSDFSTVKWEAKDAGTANLMAQKSAMRLKQQQLVNATLHNAFTYLVSLVIFVNLVLLLMTSPLNDPNSIQMQMVTKLDMACTVFFALEAILKIIAQGFVQTSLPKSKPYLLQFWNCVDFTILILAIIDIFAAFPNYDGLPGSFKCIRTAHLLKLFRKNDLLDIIVHTMYRSLTPIMITLVMTFTFIFIYGLIGVSLLRGKYYYCLEASASIPVEQVLNKYECLSMGGSWINFARNFDNIFVAMLTLFEVMSSEDWLTVAYRGIDAVGIDMQPQRNHNQSMLLFFLPFVIIGHIFIWRMYGGVMIENFNRARDKFYDYALMTSEQRNWVEMQRSLIEKRLKVRIDDHMSTVRQLAKVIILSQKFDYTILACIFLNTILQAISYYGNPPQLDTVQEVAGYIFAGVFNIECILKLLALGKYYFWESHNIFDFALIIGSNMGILLTMALPSFSIGPLATLLRAFRIGRILRLLKQKRSLKMLIDTIFYIFPILGNIVLYMLIIIAIYSIIGIHLFSKVMYQKEVNENANFQSLGGAILLLFRVTTGEKWNILMEEFALEGNYRGRECKEYQSYQDYALNGPMECGSQLSYIFFLSFVVLMQLMVVNLFIAIVLEGFAQFSIQNNSIVSSQDYDMLIDLWSFYDPTATGWIKPKHLAFLMYELQAPLGKQEDYKEILKKTLDHNTMIKQYSDKKAINMKTKFIYNDQKGLILPHNTVLKLLIDLSLPVYSFDGNSVCHFKDVCLTITKKALKRHIESKKDTTEARKEVERQFDKIPEEQQKRLDDGWRKKYKNLTKAQLIDDYDTGKLWAGLYILKMIRSVNNGFGRTQFKKKLAQNRLFKKLQMKNNLLKRENIGEKGAGGKPTDKRPSSNIDVDDSEQDPEAIEIVDQKNSHSKSGSRGNLLIPAIRQPSEAAGGPRNRGRSPNMLRDHQKSTWWKPGGMESLQQYNQSIGMGMPQFHITTASQQSSTTPNNRASTKQHIPLKTTGKASSFNGLNSALKPQPTSFNGLPPRSRD